MGYYNITLSADASKLCTIVTPFGKYEYLQLPMGVSVAPDIFGKHLKLFKVRDLQKNTICPSSGG
jgi:hypothetical protein